MFYIRIEKGLPKEISDKNPGSGPHWIKGATKLSKATGWLSSRDFASFADAESMVKYLVAMTGETYLPVDEGSGTYPRYRVIKAPKVGDEVSRCFNGDYYPCGKITKITPTWQVTTDGGQKFRRFKASGGWRETGRGFWMVAGVHDERNPSF